ncbi:MAG: sulfotransferase [Pseudomonadota bacterium]
MTISAGAAATGVGMRSGAPHVLIVGNGRSGTNWVLEILNAHRETFCRNEIQELTSSPYLEFVSELEKSNGSLNDGLADWWTRAMAHSLTHCGVRDTRFLCRKTFLYRWSFGLGAANWTARPKLRRLVAHVYPPARKEEWLFPAWIGSRDLQRKSKGVLKINDMPAWVFDWIAGNSSAKFIHVVRHPAAQLRSGIDRFFSVLSKSEAAIEEAVYEERLTLLAERYPDVNRRLETISPKTLLEKVYLFWLFNNELLHVAGHALPKGRYFQVIYEELALGYEEVSQRIFDFSGLEVDKELLDRLGMRKQMSVWGKVDTSKERLSSRWHKTVPDELKALVSESLKDSPLNDLWATR